MGKSTFLRLLQGEKFDGKINVSTDGLHISNICLYRSSGVLNKDHVSSQRDDFKANKGIRFNVLDFGGQDIFQSTHRLFLTSSAIYVVMCDLSNPASFPGVGYPFVSRNNTLTANTPFKYFDLEHTLDSANTGSNRNEQ